MKEKPFDHTRPLIVGEALYNPAEVLNLIRTNGGFLTSGDLEKHFKGQKLLAKVTITDFEVSGLIQPTDEFKEDHISGVFNRLYRLTPIGETIDGSLLVPRMNLTVINYPPDLLVLLGKMADKTITPEEEKTLKEGIEKINKQLRFPTANNPN